MRLIPALLLLVGAACSLQAQWQIFAEKLPESGSWATYRMERSREGKVFSTADLRVSVTEGGDVGGMPHAWLTIEPVGWLGSREKGPLRLLLPRNLGRSGASRLLENAAAIVFENPKKGAYRMRAEDVAWLMDWANLTYESELTPEGPSGEKTLVAGKEYACGKYRMRTVTATDPPLVPKQTITMDGALWRDESTPFAVVKAEWSEKTVKRSGTAEDRRTLTLTGFGRGTPGPPPGKAEAFSLWRLIFGR
ncbi:MAG: hypothetical protein ACO3ND_00810 [Opitutales bacterium]